MMSTLPIQARAALKPQVPGSTCASGICHVDDKGQIHLLKSTRTSRVKSEECPLSREHGAREKPLWWQCTANLNDASRSNLKTTGTCPSVAH
jgi:hypothetical protein